MQDMGFFRRSARTEAAPDGAGVVAPEAPVAADGTDTGGERTQMEKRTGHVPDTVHRAAETAWGKWKNKLAFAKAPKAEDDLAARSRADAEALKSPEQRMIEKIKLRMTQLPDWYETDPAKVAKLVAAELERIGTVLDAKLAEAEEPVEVWQIPLSVFNWLVQTSEGETFVRGALRAWSNAQYFNAANAANLDEAQKSKLRAPLLDQSPMLLNVVLKELIDTGLVVTFSKKFVGPEFKALVMRVQSPIAE